MAYELTGKVKLLQEAKTFDSGFTKREMVVIVEDGRYYNNLQGWKVTADADAAGDASAPPPTEAPPADVYDDDIPF